jgi:hypothetical protein
MYKALIEIGGYKKGDVVPDEKAEVWLQMYSVPPVEKVSGSEKPKEAPKEESSELMFDDYLDRGVNVVKKNLKQDKFDKKTLQGLLKMEKANKNRNMVIEAIKEKLEAG